MTSPRSYPRSERVRAQLKHVLAAEVERLRDPGLGFVTITDVTVTPDLRHAKAYYTVMGEQTVHAATRDAMQRATKHLRSAIARSVRLKFVPELELIEDETPDRMTHIDALLAKLHREDE